MNTKMTADQRHEQAKKQKHLQQSSTCLNLNNLFEAILYDLAIAPL